MKAALRSPHFSGLADLRRRQALFVAHADASVWLAELFAFKLGGQLDVLAFLKNRKTGLEGPIQQAIDKMNAIHAGIEALKTDPKPVSAEFSSRLMGMEGSIAREYWGSLSSVLAPEWRFDGRSRQPAKDAFNAALNYLYGMTYPVVESALFAAGLDPYLGVLHADQYDAPTLAFDCIEAFRPWVDELIVAQFLTGQATPDMFAKDEATGGVLLAVPGKRFWIPLFNDYLKANIYFLGKRASRRTHINRFAGEFANRLKNLVL